MIIIYVILGIAAALVCAMIAIYVGSFIHLMRDPEKFMKLRKLADELKAREENNTVCEACITMRKPIEIAIIESNVTDPPKRFRYCNDKEDCRQVAFIKLMEYVNQWRASLKEKTIA